MTAGNIWYLQCLGGLRAVRGEQTVERFRTQRTASLLAFLALRPGPHSREVLIDLLWPGSEPDAGRNNLSTSLSSLRRQLEADLPSNSILVADRASIGLNSHAIDTDVRRFEVALDRASECAGVTERAQLLADALTLYRGQLLPGLFDDWVQAEARCLEEKFSTALKMLLPLLESSGQIERAIEFTQRGVNVQPAHETWHLALMQLYAANAQFEFALRQFKDLQKALRRAGEEPSNAAHLLLKQIRRQVRLSDSASAAIIPAPDHVAIPAASASNDGEHKLPLLSSGVVSLLMMDCPSMETERKMAEHFAGEHGGTPLHRSEDTCLWGFGHAGQAAAASIAIQVEVRKRISPVLPRAALVTGEVEADAGRVRGEVLDRAARLLLATHPGQILCDEVSAGLLTADTARHRGTVTDLGRFRLGEERVQRLFQVGVNSQATEAPVLKSTFPPPRALTALSGSLPPTFTRFFGRGDEIETLHSLLQDERLITVSGIGGCGKTRLAIETARQMFEDWQSAVWFVPLAEIREPELIVPAIRDVMRLPTTPGAVPREQIIEALSAQASLLILDNFEQLAETGALCVAELMEATPNLKIIVTSRHKLNLPGERELPLSPLPVPEEEASLAQLKEFSSTALFIDRARAVRADFALSERNARATSALCRRLDGIPLALELAAARSLVFSPPQILQKLEGQLDFLESRQKGVPERHRTLRAAIEWSYELLSPDLQKFFARLSAFHGDWTVQAAESVCQEPDALESLTRLRECSLVQVRGGEDAVRFGMLETLREYAASRVEPDEAMELAKRHFGYFLKLAEASNEGIYTIDQGAVLEAEQDNFRAALSWAMSRPEAGGAEDAVRLSGALSGFYEARGHYIEALPWLQRALAQGSEAAPQWRARALSGMGRLLWFASRFEEAEKSLHEGLALFRALGDERSIIYSLDGLSRVALTRGKVEDCRIYAEESLALSRSLADQLSLRVTLCWAHINSGRLNEARSMLSNVVEEAREAGYPGIQALSLNMLGWTCYLQHDYLVAQQCLDDSLQITRERNQVWDLGQALCMRGSIARALGDFATAREVTLESLLLLHRSGAQWALTVALDSMGYLAIEQGQPENGAQLMGAAERLREKLNNTMLLSLTFDDQHYQARLRDLLGPQVFEAAWNSGRLMSPERAVALALRNA